MAVRHGDATLYVAERTGRVRAIRNGQVDPNPVVDMSTLTKAGGEQGLLGMAFSPDGKFLYLDYTDVKGDSHVDEYTVAADGSVDPSTRRQVLFQSQPYPNHNGGSLVFGPDGYLYIGFGDGGSEGDPQRRGLDLSTWLGKLLRIDPRPNGDQPYTVPADNPFVGRSGVKPEIWAYGLRNPWRFSFDSATGDLWIGDVGQNTLEEVDEGPAADGGGKGLNYGWSAFEGTDRYNKDQSPAGTVGPVYEYQHSGNPGGCAIAGGYVYRGQKIPALQGAYLFGDYCVAGIRAFPTGVANPTATVLASTPDALDSFGEGPDGELYAFSLNGGVYRIDPA
jgi:glucose/arabinose dehydrogenase